jgi:hypothetical protein
VGDGAGGVRRRRADLRAVELHRDHLTWREAGAGDVDGRARAAWGTEKLIVAGPEATSKFVEAFSPLLLPVATSAPSQAIRR